MKELYLTYYRQIESDRIFFLESKGKLYPYVFNLKIEDTGRTYKQNY